jgi:glycosyltransferase involved in cell wall biosynthesis
MNYRLVSVILPVYRQGAHIEAVVRAFQRELVANGIGHEFVLVVNGPDDGSLAVCQALAEEAAGIRVIREERAGWGSSVRRGIAEARGDLVCYTNSARTSAETLASMIGYASALPGIVIKANRKTRDSVWRHLGSLIYNLECRALFDLSNFDINGTPKVFPRTCVGLFELTRDDDMIDAEFLAVCRESGYPVLELPVVITRRHGGASTTRLMSAARMYLGAVLLKQQRRRRVAARTAPVR